MRRLARRAARGLLPGLAAALAFAAPRPAPAEDAPAADAASSFAELRAASSPVAARDTVRRAMADALVAGRAREGAAALAAFVARAYRRPGAAGDTAALAVLAEAADGAALLAMARDARLRADVAEWLFGAEERWARLSGAATPHDDLSAALRIVEQLYDRDPAGRDAFFELILAFALVWDQPRRPMHGQMGPAPLPYEPQIPERYDYFRQLYEGREARLPYARLNVASLVFVVDTPVPLSELEWARKNVRGTSATWGRKYHEIRYNQLRLAQSVFTWPHGAYTLGNIEARGGICVDQAYYATLTARAWGIPAIFFAGPGRRGGHAWFAHLKGEDRWEMDVGRYDEDQYQTGVAVHPQTNRPLTDHELAFQCDRALRRGDYDRAQRLARIAEVLLAAGAADDALELARMARGAAPLFLRPWDLEAAVLLKRGDLPAAIELWTRQAAAFRRFPDVETAARAQIEDLLRSQRREGAKILPLLAQYIETARQGGESAEAARFVEGYAVRLRRELGAGTPQEAALQRLLLTAYTYAGDTRKIEALQRELERGRRSAR